MGKKCCESVSTSSSCSSSACVQTEVDCCKKCTDVVNCCTPQYQRLDKLRNQWSSLNMNARDWQTYPYAVDRNGNSVSSTSLFGSGLIDVGDASGNLNVALAFVIVHRYLNIETCKSDQVWGWYVNLNSGDLRFMQETENVDTTVSRHEIYTKSVSNLTVAEKRARCVLDRFFKLSQNVVECHRYPRTEGDIVEVSDSCGQKWLVAVNLANDNQDHGSGGDIDAGGDSVVVRAQTGRYVLVACKL